MIFIYPGTRVYVNYHLAPGFFGLITYFVYLLN
jgi:hypothetical protein